jgi:hypothetical protein
MPSLSHLLLGLFVATLAFAGPVAFPEQGGFFSTTESSNDAFDNTVPELNTRGPRSRSTRLPIGATILVLSSAL